MPLKFEGVEEKDDKEAQTPKKKEPTQSSGGSSTGKSGKQQHHRVFTVSSCYFAILTVKVISASNLPGKKSACPFVRVYLGSNSFCTAVKKKSLSPEWNEEFTSSIDRDDTIQFKIWDNAKLERNLDNFKTMEPMAKKKIPVKDLARMENVVNKRFDYTFTPSGTLTVEMTLKISPPQAGEVHIKQFNYPTWVNDKYNINYVPPTFDPIKVGVTTLARYATRWLLNQRAIMASLANKDDDSSEGEQQESEVPEGLEFKLLDISFASHQKALQLVVTYQWAAKVEKAKNDDDDWDAPSILQVKVFSVASHVPKKKWHEFKSTPSDSYMRLFQNVCDGTQEALNLAHSWLKENPDSYKSVFKLIPISTPVSHHCMLWYYR